MSCETWRVTTSPRWGWLAQPMLHTEILPVEMPVERSKVMRKPSPHPTVSSLWSLAFPSWRLCSTTRFTTCRSPRSLRRTSCWKWEQRSRPVRWAPRCGQYAKVTADQRWKKSPSLTSARLSVPKARPCLSRVSDSPEDKGLPWSSSSSSNRPPWLRFHLGISRWQLYPHRDPNVELLIQQLATHRIVSAGVPPDLCCLFFLPLSLGVQQIHYSLWSYCGMKTWSFEQPWGDQVEDGWINIIRRQLSKRSFLRSFLFLTPLVAFGWKVDFPGFQTPPDVFKDTILKQLMKLLDSVPQSWRTCVSYLCAHTVCLVAMETFLLLFSSAEVWRDAVEAGDIISKLRTSHVETHEVSHIMCCSR